MPVRDNSIGAAEDALRHAQLAGDVGAIERLLDDTLVFTGPDGLLYSKSDDLQAYREGWVRITQLDPSEERIMHLRSEPGVAVVIVRMQMAGHFKGADFAGSFRYTRVWTEHADGWRITAGHVSAVTAD